MRIVNEVDKYRILYQVWFLAYEKAIRDVLGKKPKIVAMKAYENVVRYFLYNVAYGEYKIEIPKFNNPIKALQWYIELLHKFRIVSSISDFKVKQVNNSIEVEVFKCPYIEICSNLTREGVELKDLTCPRIGCFRAALIMLTNRIYEYRVSKIKLKEGCKGIIRPICR